MDTRTKIIWTIGQAFNTYEKIVELMDAGMSFARLDFTQGSVWHKWNDRIDDVGDLLVRGRFGFGRRIHGKVGILVNAEEGIPSSL